MAERSIKALKNSSHNIEILMQNKASFIPEYLSESLFYSLLEQLNAKELQQLGKTAKNIEGMQPGKGQAKARSTIHVLHKMVDTLDEERKAIKSQKDEQSIVFSYDAILKNCIMRIRRLIFLLTYYI